MQKIIQAAEMREIDRLTSEQYATPSLLLMEAAANAAARVIASHFSHNLARRTALILCGRGNNGGDGAALARTLWMLGAKVDVVLFGRVEDAKGDARTNFEMVRHLASFHAGTKERPSPLFFVECDTINAWEERASKGAHYDIMVDALFGTGLTRPLEGIFREVVEHIALVRQAREHAADPTPLIVSLDLPSGLDADATEPIGAAVQADVTVTFTAPKPANVLPPAAHFNGQLVVAPVGSPPALLEATTSQLYLAETTDAQKWLEQTRYTPDSYKNTHGHALIVAGSRHMTGAAVLCADAAMRSGAGLVTLATPASASDAIAARLMPEVITASLSETAQGATNLEAVEQVMKLASRADVLAVGPGLTSDDEDTRQFVRALVERRTKCIVIDADGLNALAPWHSELRGSKEAPLILTPHAGEMRRLLGGDDEAQARRLRANRVDVAREFAVSHQLILVLKGTRTLVAAPDGRVVVVPTGNAGLGTAGSGDTLTGIITGFNAQEFATLKTEADAFAATLAAVFVGGLAGDMAARERGMRSMVASDIREHIGAAIHALDPKGEQPHASWQT
ncbi:MAG TPA: NAD(P)H-hydrate dehydratase [Pyrinomonadaceae bacterium]